MSAIHEDASWSIDQVPVPCREVPHIDESVRAILRNNYVSITKVRLYGRSGVRRLVELDRMLYGERCIPQQGESKQVS